MKTAKVPVSNIAALVESSIPQYWAVSNLADACPVFMFETERTVQDVLTLLNMNSDGSREAAIAHRLCSHGQSGMDEILTAAGYDTEKMWGLECELDAYPFSSFFTAHSTDREALCRMAIMVSRVLPAHLLKVERWSRIRFMFKDGEIFRSFAEVPYLNMSVADWF